MRSDFWQNHQRIMVLDVKPMVWIPAPCQVDDSVQLSLVLLNRKSIDGVSSNAVNQMSDTSEIPAMLR